MRVQTSSVTRHAGLNAKLRTMKCLEWERPQHSVLRRVSLHHGRDDLFTSTRRAAQSAPDNLLSNGLIRENPEKHEPNTRKKHGPQGNDETVKRRPTDCETTKTKTTTQTSKRNDNNRERRGQRKAGTEKRGVFFV